MVAQIEEKEAVVGAQQKAYEQVRTERNVYFRDLVAAQAEVAEAKRRLSMVVSFNGLTHSSAQWSTSSFLCTLLKSSEAQSRGIHQHNLQYQSPAV